MQSKKLILIGSLIGLVGFGIAIFVSLLTISNLQKDVNRARTAPARATRLKNLEEFKESNENKNEDKLEN